MSTSDVAVCLIVKLKIVWIAIFRHGQQRTVGDVFIGYHADTAASVTLQVCKAMESETITGEETTEDEVTTYCW